jgi:hypothetical protein
MSIDQLQTMQVIRGKRTMLGPEDAGHTGLFHAAPGRPRKVDKVSTMRHRRQCSVSVILLTLAGYLHSTNISLSLRPLNILWTVVPLPLQL